MLTNIKCQQIQMFTNVKQMLTNVNKCQQIQMLTNVNKYKR